MSPRDGDLDALRHALTDQAEDVARALLGPENRRGSRSELRWRSKGSLALALRGRRRGLWHDHESLEGGDLLALIRRETGADFAGAVAWARQFLGWPTDGPVPVTSPPTSAPADHDAPDEEELARIEEARRVWASCSPIEGTLAERYLTRRGIFRSGKKGWPDALGYHARRKALVVRVTDDQGELVAVQSIALAEPGTKADVETVKRSTGPVSRGAVRLPGPDDGPVIFAEGPETGLSIWAATGLATHIALGNPSNLTVPTDRPVILARDDDPRWSPASRKARQTVADWQAQGHRVAVAWPWDIRRGDKTDFNDVLRERGPAAVRERIELARSFLDGTVAPLPERVTLAEARARLDEEVGGFFDDVLDGEGSSLALRVDLGTGKTEAALRHAARTLARMRAAGDDRAIALAVPEHRLGAQIVERFNTLAREEGLDLRAASWRGRNALDPMRTDGERMCGNLEAVERAQALLLDVEKTICAHCPLASSCAYLAQKGQTGDLWVVGHRLVFGRKPKAIPDLAALIIDESPWQAALIGTDGKPLSLPLDALTDEAVPVPDGDPITGDGARLRSLREAMAEALAGHPDGPVRRDVLLDVGLDQESGRDGAALEWARQCEEGDLEPNRNLRRFAHLWRAVEELLAPTGPALSGHLELTRDEEGIRQIVLRGRKPPGDAFRIPTLFLDASLDAELLRPVFGPVAVAEPVLVEQAHVRIRQIADRAFSKAALDAGSITDAKEAARRRRNLRDVHAHIYALACEPGDTLIVANKGITDTLRGMRWPGNVSFAHFNATAGRDDWKDVRRLVVIGRPMPRPESIQRMAAALTGQAVERIKGTLPTCDASRRLRNGDTVQAEAVTHPDPMAARILDRIVSGEVSQAIGRGRGVSRTDETPLDVHVVGGDVILDEADELTGWERPGPDDLMRAAGGIIFAEPAHAASAYPNLWPSAPAARMAMNRARWRTHPYRNPIIGECSLPLAPVRYQRPGPGQRPALAYIEAALDPRDALASLLGPVTLLPLDDGETFQRGTARQDAVTPAPAANDDTPPDIAPDVSLDDGTDEELDPVAAFALRGGVIPLALRPAARRLQRESGWRQDELARRIGISRPQLANGLQGRFGLSPEPARALVELIAKPPLARAPLLF